MFIRMATVEDVDGMMELDYKYYPEEWHVAIEDVKRMFQIGSNLARVIDTPNGIKGYYAHIPLSKEAFENILNGELSESGLSEYVLDYRNHPKEVYLYSVSIIVDIEDPNRKAYTKALIGDMPNFFHSITQQGTIIKELGAIVISEAGRRIAKSIGYQETGELLGKDRNKYPTFRAQLDDIYRAIIVN
jgi:hypothetical protein